MKGKHGSASAVAAIALEHIVIGRRPSTLPSLSTHTTSFSAMGAGAPSAASTTTCRCVQSGLSTSARV